jgi:hypothetical protein
MIVATGLAARSEWLGLTPFLAKYAGDALWAIMIYLALGLLFPARSIWLIAGLAAIVCVVVELSQLYRAPWIDAIRPTWFGRLVLGDTFACGDIAAYFVGIGLGATVEWTADRYVSK